jgi:hypothetical protein
MTDEIKTKKPIYKKWWFWLIGFFVIIIIASASGNEKTTTPSVTEENQPQTEIKKTEIEKPTDKEKSYQEVFTFNGNGAKKSEPFNIEGDRFKITYDCQGDPNLTLCQAFVYRVGSNLPQVVVNSNQPTKDETIIYTSMAGKGEYYIDANMMGNFTMVVYDYK